MVYHIRHIETHFVAETKSFYGNSKISWMGSKNVIFVLGCSVPQLRFRKSQSHKYLKTEVPLWEVPLCARLTRMLFPTLPPTSEGILALVV